MANRSQNEGFRVLDDFICQAIPNPDVPQASPTNYGQNEGMRVIEELVFAGTHESLEQVEADLDARLNLLSQEDDLELYGFGLVRSYSMTEFASNPGLEWFRTTVGDLRDSMEAGLQVGIGQIEVYRTLLLAHKKRGTKRQRRGVVVYGGKSPTLYITEEGIANPRVRYEEIAHCLIGRIALDQVFRGAEYMGPASFYLPITNHAAIYKSFLQSRSFSECSPSEKQLAVEIAARLKEQERVRGKEEDHQPAQSHFGEVVLRLPRVGIVQSADLLLLAS